MHFIASAVMRGRASAVMIVTVLAMLTFLFPPVSVISSAAVALVTLRQGVREGIVLLLLSGIAAALLSQLIAGTLFPVVGFMLVMWLPMVFLGTILRNSRSLSRTLQMAVGLGLLFVLIEYLQAGDPVKEWQSLLQPFAQSLVEAGLVVKGEEQKLLEILAQWMPGIFAAGILLQSFAGLLLARWWQAMLYNPGGFRAEFHQLRFSRSLAMITLVIVIARLLISDGTGSMVDAAMMVLIAAWFIQGLALAHGSLAILDVSNGWLFGIYFLLLFAMPHAVMVLASAGFSDAWFDFRARLAERRNSDER